MASLLARHNRQNPDSTVRTLQALAPLQGGNNYKLHVSPTVPVKEFWYFTVYEMNTSALFRNAD
jgi:hypothetical protein